MRVMVALLLCGCFAVTPPVHFGGKSTQDLQYGEAHDLTPPLLVQDQRWKGEVRVAKIRVWADEQFRAQNVRWQHTFGEQLEYANAVLGPQFGLRLEAEYREWPRHAPTATIEESLAALAQQDPGNDVFAVVGLTSSLGMVSEHFDKLGIASLPGRHIVLRGYADLEERQAFAVQLRELHADEREQLLEARRRHKTTAVFLHELGHNLGAAHELEPDTIMAAIYSYKAAAFSEDARDTMLRSLEQRLGGGKGPKTAPADREPALTLALDGDGEVVLGGRAMSAGEVDDMLRAAFVHGPDTEVDITVAKGAPQARVIELLDRAHAIGLHRISISAP